MAALVALSSPALAIPSPELVVGSISSLSQLIALLSALLGGGAIAVGRRAGARNAATTVWQSRLSMAAYALLALMIGLNIYQLLDRQGERQSRLEATLVRPSRAPHEAPADPNLKEIPFSRQLSHPLGMPTETAAAVIDRVGKGEAADTVLIDIRETAEVEAGRMPLSRAIRFPDLPHAGLDLAGKKVVLFCHNGNRSAETCEALAKRGIDCRFMIGGMEKWLTEGRRLEGSEARSLGDLRALPDYRNSKVLLETAEVKQLLERDNAQLVDVRYPGEFERTHLADAISLPMRPLPTEELKRRLDDLPQRPVIAPCYDRRSCFYAELLGLELTRAGRDYRGRYTTPWEYFAASTPPPHVLALADERKSSTWSWLAETLAVFLGETSRFVGLPLSLLALAALSRLLVLPFSLKAERDQMTTERVKDDFAALRKRLADDPPRLARATQAFYRRHGLTPVRNLVALLFLPVLAIAMQAAQLAAAARPESLLWLDSLAERDPTLALPILLAVLICLYIDMCFARSWRSRLAIWLIGVPAFVFTGAILSAAGDIYIVASSALLLVQRFFVVGGHRWLAALPGRLVASRQHDDGTVPFSQPDRLTGAGNKAYRLARIKSLGLPVPDGLVLTADFLADFEQASLEARRRMAARLWRRMGRRPLAVRSSAAAEDGAGASFAGVFDSILNVDSAGLCKAIGEVLASFHSNRAAAYALGSGSENVLLQPMFQAEISGVLFTRDPQAPGMMLIETVSGGLDQLVSGRAAPQVLRYGRLTGTKAGTEPSPGAPPVDLAPLLALGWRIEHEFGAPQDIEWAYAKGRFVILQSRDITSMQGGADDAAADEWARLESAVAGPDRNRDRKPQPRRGLPRSGQQDEVILARTDMSELLPRPTPLSLSLLEGMWASGGSIDLAARSIGAGYDVEEDARPYHVAAFGRLYVDRREESGRALRFSGLVRRRLERNALSIETRFRDTFMPEFRERIVLLEAANFDLMPLPDLVAATNRVVDAFLRDTHVEVDIVNIAARCFLDTARHALDEAGLEPTVILADIPQTALSAALAAANRAAPDQRRQALLACAGHRASIDYELSNPRFFEDPSGLDSFLAAALPAAGAASHAGSHAKSEPIVDLKLAAIVDRARRYQTLKEDAKDTALRELSVIRRMFCSIDRHLGLDGVIFHVTLDEIAALGGPDARSVIAAARSRRSIRERLLDAPPLGRTLSVSDLELGPLAAQGATAAPGGLPGQLLGTRVAGGSTVVQGRAHVVGAQDAENGSALDGFMPGDIIVAPMVHPVWLPQVLQAAAVVSELGGWLSHMAIVAREHRIPMVVGVANLASILPGTVLKIEGTGQIIDLGVDAAAGEALVAAQ